MLNIIYHFGKNMVNTIEKVMQPFILRETKFKTICNRLYMIR